MEQRSLNCQHQGGQELELSSMVNKCESLINVVTHDKPKMLMRLEPKGKWLRIEITFFSIVDVTPPAKKARPNLLWYLRGTWKTCNRPSQEGKQVVR